MGKKARMRRYPQKFGRKFASHPFSKALANLKEVKEEAMADGVVTKEEGVKIAEATKAVEETEAPKAEEAIKEAKPAPKPKAKKAPVKKKAPAKKKVAPKSTFASKKKE